MPSSNCKSILIAPLDWGLGHTTRCIPLIGYMLQQGHHITFAGNEWQRRFINNTYPRIETIHLDGYNINYGKTGKNLRFSIFSQVPHLLKAVRKEQHWLQERLEARNFDAIISDNRYGLWHPTIPSVIMTHQLQVITGMGTGVDKLFQKLHYKYLNRFQNCWVVDHKGNPNLAGRLSQTKILPQKATYIGLLSQFAASAIPDKETEPYLLVLLSGPEPQRTILSKLVWEQVQDHKGKVVFVEGSADATTPDTISPHIIYYKQLAREQLLPLLQSAEMVICRSGYSTLMDLAALNKKAIVIPTPGQTEQEYLGDHLYKKGVFYSIKQKELDLQKVLEKANAFHFYTAGTSQSFELYKTVLNNWLPGI